MSTLCCIVNIKVSSLTVLSAVPAYHCMHTPGGPLKFSLEAHQFAVFDFRLTSDSRLGFPPEDLNEIPKIRFFLF